MDTKPEETMFLDVDGHHIVTGDIVRKRIEINQDLHGTWADYRVRKAPGGYVLSYLISEKGAILPEGYTAGYMADQLADEDDVDLKTLVFTLKPIRVTGWIVVNK